MKRTEAREVLMQILFQMEAQKDYSLSIKDKFLTNKKPGAVQKEYIDELTKRILDNLNALDAIIDKATSNWSVKRMAKVDLAIARLAAGEIYYMDDIPMAVSVNEAVNMARKYGSEDSRKFINGLLGKIVEDFESEEM